MEAIFDYPWSTKSWAGTFLAIGYFALKESLWLFWRIISAYFMGIFFGAYLYVLAPFMMHSPLALITVLACNSMGLWMIWMGIDAIGVRIRPYWVFAVAISACIMAYRLLMFPLTPIPNDETGTYMTLFIVGLAFAQFLVDMVVKAFEPRPKEKRKNDEKSVERLSDKDTSYNADYMTQDEVKTHHAG